MNNYERLNGNDQIHALSKQEIAKLKKERAQRLREKFGLSNQVSETQILNQENRVFQIQKDLVHQTEQEVSTAEGNIAENLVQAAESGGDQDISQALNQAQQYQQSSDQKIKKHLSDQMTQQVSQIFQKND